MATSTTSAQGKSTTRHGRGGVSKGSNIRKNNKANAKPALTDSGNQVQTSTTADVVSAEEQTLVAAADETCWICSEPVKFYSVPECNHRTCHVCAVRLRALYKKMECTFCKHPQPSIIFSQSPSKLFADYTPNMIPFCDEKLNISFETREMMEETLFLLRFNCPNAECDFTGTGWSDLKWHVKDAHGQLLCDICIRNKKIFAHEHTLYQPKQFLLHLPSLRKVPTMPGQQRGREKDPDNDKDPGKELAVDVVHPLCTFCRECFYGDDELYAHLKEKHEECFVCKRLGNRDVYFQNFEKLDGHFHAEHFPCTHPSCLEQKFVVFPNALDLQAHQVQIHGEAMSVRQRKDKRRVDPGFAFEEVRSGRSSGRPNRTTSGAQASVDAIDGPRRPGFNGSLALNDRETGTPQSQDPPREMELHANDVAPLQQFLRNLSVSAQFSVISSVRSFRASECSARDTLDTIFNVFDRNLDVTGIVVTKALDVFDGHAEKRHELLEAWNGIKIEERQQFPSLAPISSSSQAGYAGIASGRVLNLKKSTSAARASSNGGTSHRVWDRVEQAATASYLTPLSSVPGRRAPRPAISSSTSSTSFPSLVGAGPSRGQGSRQTSWVASTPKPSISSSTSQSSTPTTSTPRVGNAAPSTASMSHFPSLPASNRSLAPREFVNGNQSLKNIIGDTAGPGRNAWGSASPAPESESTQSLGIEDAARGAKTKKKKGKERLFTLGAFPAA